jgi:hypothetical protein
VKNKGKPSSTMADEGRREPLTPAHAAAEAEADAMVEDRQAEAARKAVIPGLEADPGPGTFTDPVMPPAAGQFVRPYLDAGHCAPSPQHQAPNPAPVPPGQPGVVTPLQVQVQAVPTVTGTGPVVAGLAAHQARAAKSMPPMPPARGWQNPRRT